MFKPTVGPIVGHTTTDHARIFLRGDHGNSRVFAAIRHRRRGDTRWSKGHFVQLKAYRDMSDVIVLNGLQPDTTYEYQAGWFSPLSPTHTVESIQELPLQWPRNTYSLRTPAAGTDAPRAYIVGSCRYLRIAANTPLLPALGDRTFAGINRIVEQADPPISAVLMTGDQVYLDDLNVIGPDRTYKNILLRYRTVLAQPHIRTLMSGTPTYMMLDDHEIEDNWPARKTVNDDVLYANAMSAYELYQASHGPAHELSSDGTVDKSLTRYWYTFAHGDIIGSSPTAGRNATCRQTTGAFSTRNRNRSCSNGSSTAPPGSNSSSPASCSSLTASVMTAMPGRHFRHNGCACWKPSVAVGSGTWFLSRATSTAP